MPDHVASVGAIEGDGALQWNADGQYPGLRSDGFVCGAPQQNVEQSPDHPTVAEEGLVVVAPVGE